MLHLQGGGLSYAGDFNGVLFFVGSGCSGLCGILLYDYYLDVCFIYFSSGGQLNGGKKHC